MPRSTLLRTRRLAPFESKAAQESFFSDSPKIDAPKSSSSFGNALRAQGTREGIGLINKGFGGFTDFAEGIAGAQQLEFNAKQETLIGEQQALQTLTALNNAQAANIVASFASGIRLQGSITRAQTALGKKAAFSTAISKTNSIIRAESLKREARRRRAEADYNKRVAPLKIVAGAVITYFSAGQV